MSPTESLAVQHTPAAGRFFVTLDGVEAELIYRMRQGKLVIEHTGVPDAIGGRGVAAVLVQTALDYARTEGLKVLTPCSYAAVWIQRHPDYRDLLD